MKNLMFAMVIATTSVISAMGQCVIPNGSCDSFDFVSTPRVSYEFPANWNESEVINFFYRRLHGFGFFSRYSGSDASDSTALFLQRSGAIRFESMNKGYLTMKCSNAPSKLIGRYKFTGTSTRPRGITDTLRIVVQFGNTQNPIMRNDLEIERSFSPQISATLNIIEDTSLFTNFEIDLSHLAPVNPDSIAIHLMLMGNDWDSSIAVIDDLEFVYTHTNVGADLLSPRYTISPNPTSGSVTVKGSSEIAQILIYDPLGKMILDLHDPAGTEVELPRNSGIYYIKIVDKMGTQFMEKILRF